MNKTNAQPGDLVEISLVKNVYRGILLESPEGEKGIVLLKLASGYNLGFHKKDILSVDLIKKAEGKKEGKLEAKKQKDKPNIAMIMTGGTIANKYDPKTGAVSPLTSSEELFQFYPELFGLVNVVKIETPFLKASEDMDSKDWKKIASLTAKFLNDSNISGIIITHGTDTLHYTAAALSFFLGEVNKPVVLTYSQRSSDRPSSDADLNLRCSALAAISDITEVMLVGHASTNDDFCYAMPGTKVRKLHSSRRDAFKVVNANPFARIYPDRIELMAAHRTNKNKKFKADIKFEEKIALVKVYPGQDPDILDYYRRKGYKGIVIEATGLGHVPALTSRKSWISSIKRIISKGIAVCIATQCIFGRVNPYVYSNLRALNKTGAIFLEDMLAETALVKLGWVLGHKEWARNKEEVRKKMLENISGEFSDRLQG